MNAHPGDLCKAASSGASHRVSKGPWLATVGALGRVGSRIRRALAVSAATACLAAGGCSPSQTHPLASPSARGSPEYAIAFAAARAARDRAFALRPPSTSDLEAASEEAIVGALRQWASARRDATEEAQRAYTEALHAARDPSDEAALHGELADLWLRLEEDTRSIALAATPARYRDKPSLVSSVQSEIAETLRPLRDRVATHLEICKRIVDQTHSVGSAAETCAAVARRLEGTNELPKPRPTPPPAPSGVAAVTPRPILPTTRPRPCLFKGTLVTRGTVYAEETGTSVVLTVDLGTPIEVEALHAASRVGGRYKVAVSWPKVVHGYLDAEAAPFVLMRRVELVPDAVWAASGVRVGASEERGPTVRATRAFADPVAGASPRKPVPDTLDRRLFCHDLELATAAPASEAPTAPGVSFGARAHLRTDVVVPLRAKPGGPAVASVVADEVLLLELRGSFAHVVGDAPFDFVGWVDASFLRPSGGGGPLATADTASKLADASATAEGAATGAAIVPKDDAGQAPPAREEAPPRVDAPIAAEAYEPAKAFRTPTPGTSYQAQVALLEGYDTAPGGVRVRPHPSFYTGIDASIHLITWTRDTDRQELGLEVRGQNYGSATDLDDGTVDGLWGASFTLDRRTTLAATMIATLTSTSSAQLSDGPLFRIDPSIVNRVYTLESGHLRVVHDLSPVWRLTAALGLSASTTVKETAVPLSNGRSFSHRGLDYVGTDLGLTLTRDFDPKNSGMIGVAYVETYVASVVSLTPVPATPATSSGAATNGAGSATVGWSHIFDERLRSNVTFGGTVAEAPPLDPGGAPSLSPLAGVALTYTRAFWTTAVNLTYSYASVNPALGFGQTAGAGVALQGIPYPHGRWYRFSVVASGIANRATLVQAGGSADLDYAGASLQGRYAANAWLGLVAGDFASYSTYEQTSAVTPPLLRNIVFIGVSAVLAKPKTLTAVPIAF